jgi:hypothetical protein
MVEYNGLLYVSDSNNGRIISLDLSGTPNVTPTDVITGLDRPFGLSLNGSMLYIVDAGEGSGSTIPGRILMYDIDSGTGNPTELYELPFDSRSPRGILFNDDNLYFSDINTNKIYVTNLLTTVNFQEFSDLSNDGAGPVGMEIDGTTMYVAGRDSNIIYKISDIDTFSGSPLIPSGFIDFTSILGQWEGPEFLSLNGSILYISGRDANQVGSADLSQANPNTSLTNITSATSPGQVRPYNNGTSDNLYIAEDNYVSFFDLGTLSVSDNNAFPKQIKLNVFPNPTSSEISIMGLTSRQNYSIYNLLGKLIKKGAVSNGEKITVNELSNGVYLLKLDDNSSVLRIIKE